MNYISFLILFIILNDSFVLSQPDLSYLDSNKLALYKEHIKGGQPDNDTLFIRNAYVLNYNSKFRIPDWVAFHIKPEYLNTPERKGKFDTFRTDPDVTDAVEDDEYDGLYSLKGYDRGHLAPFKIMGGDRDDDGIFAVYGTGSQSDTDDEETIFEGNYLSNIAPQHAQALNRPGGLWFALERWIQDDIVESHNKELWVYAGNIIIDKREFEGVGRNNSIIVPDMFYQVLIMDVEADTIPAALAFLFPHFKDKVEISGSLIYNYIVPIDYIEALTGLNFFNEFTEDEQKKIESTLVLTPWLVFIGD
jgi:endonuclease G